MNNTLLHTSDGLPEKTRLEMTALLLEWLADSIDLMLQARQAHQKVKDHRFNALHLLFDKIDTDARKCVDLIAGWIVQLGDRAEGALRLTAAKFGMLDIASGRKHMAEQADAIAFYVELMLKAATNSAQRRDADTPTHASRGSDMNLWFMNAHAHSKN